MAFMILPPSFDDDVNPPSTSEGESSGSDSDESMTEEVARVDGRPSKRPRLSSHSHSATQIVLPGELITNETQWMRGHGTFTTSAAPTSITASLAGPITRTNKLLSTTPLRSRYTASIGDLVIGRIVSVEKSRWKVEIAAPLLAQLPLASINLPGGVLRRRTTADELQMRKYFQEGDLVVAEVGEVNRDGGAGLHTRSLKYGKLRDGVLVVVAGQGAGASGGGSVVRGRRQTFTLGQAQGESEGGDVDVILGVNGYVWLSGHFDENAGSSGDGFVQGIGRGKGAGGVNVSISNLEDAVTSVVYSSQNGKIDARTRRAIAGVGECIKCLVEGGCRVDEETVGKSYEALMDLVDDEMDEGTESRNLDVRDKKRILEAALR